MFWMFISMKFLIEKCMIISARPTRITVNRRTIAEAISAMARVAISIRERVTVAGVSDPSKACWTALSYVSRSVPSVVLQ